MAESLVKLRVDSNEYDKKIKRATDILSRYASDVKKTGDSLANASKEAIDFVQALGGMNTEAKNTNQQVREMTKSLIELTVQYSSLTDEEKNSPFGKAMAQSIQQLTERAGAARDAMGDVSAAIKNAASDTRVFDQLSAGVSFATSSLQTLQGAAKLVGIELGDNVEVIAKLQAAMAVTNGLTTIQNALQKESALYQGLVAVQAKARLAAEALATSGTKAATVAQAAFNAVAKANPYVLLASAVAAVAAAFFIFKDRADDATEAERRNREETEQLKKAHADFAQRMQDALGSSVGQVIAKFTTLQDQWKRLKTEAEQKRWIDANQSAFNALGLSVNNVNAAYKVFVDRAPEVIAALQAIAEAKALESFKQKETERYLEMKYFSGEHKRTTENGGMYTRVGQGERDIDSSKLPGSEWVAAGLRRGVHFNTEWTGSGTIERLTDAGVKELNKYRNNQAVEKHNKLLKQQEGLIQQIDNDYDKAQQKAAKASENLPFFTTNGGTVSRGSGHTGGGTTTTAPPPPPTGSIAEQEAKVQALTKAWREATDQAGRDGYLAQLDEAKKKLEEMQGKTETLVEGSMKALNKELSDLQEAQSNVATASEWNDYEEKIKAVKKQMSELKGEVQEMATGFSGFNDNTISAWLSGQQSSLGDKEIGSADYMQTAGNIIDTQTLQNVVNATLKAGIKIDPEVIESLFEQILGGENIPDSVWQELEDNINKGIDESNIKPLNIDVETGNVAGLGKQVKESWKDAAKAVQSVGSALQQLDDPAAKIAGIIGQAIAQIALGFAQATASDSKLGVFGWIAAIAGGLGTMISTIAAIHSATGYAEGGIVKGNSYSGDNLWGGAYVNAGELVLNRAQQGALASQLEGASESGSMKPYTTGEYIYLGVKNHLSRSGQGEIVTTSMLKKMGLT